MATNYVDLPQPTVGVTQVLVIGGVTLTFVDGVLTGVS